MQNRTMSYHKQSLDSFRTEIRAIHLALIKKHIQEIIHAGGGTGGSKFHAFLDDPIKYLMESFVGWNGATLHTLQVQTPEYGKII